jgi:hypothetical protein
MSGEEIFGYVGVVPTTTTALETLATPVFGALQPNFFGKTLCDYYGKLPKVDSSTR